MVVSATRLETETNLCAEIKGEWVQKPRLFARESPDYIKGDPDKDFLLPFVVAVSYLSYHNKGNHLESQRLK